MVSIQLVSPASGDGADKQAQWIGVRLGWVSIQLVSPASGDKRKRSIGSWLFHKVSIQLVSPASGDQNIPAIQALGIPRTVSIQLVSPASGDITEKEAIVAELKATFPFN